MNEPCTTGSQASVFIEILKIIPSLAGMVFAFLTYSIGKKYFNKGQRNAVVVSRYNKKSDLLDGLLSHFYESRNILEKILDAKVANSVAEGYLQSFVDNHNATLDVMKKALFIEECVALKRDYVCWYEKWFSAVNSGMMSLVFDEKERDVAITQMKSPILSEFDAISKNVVVISKGIEPITDV